MKRMSIQTLTRAKAAITSDQCMESYYSRDFIFKPEKGSYSVHWGSHKGTKSYIDFESTCTPNSP